MYKRQELIGCVFGRLTVKKFSHISRGGQSYWVCICTCGKEKTARSSHLKSGSVRSCGCLARECSSKTAKSVLAGKYCKITHNKTHTRVFSIWTAMRARCKNPNSISYKNYGGRGIIVCKEWDSNFITFYNWAMNNGYNDNLTIDRIDNNGNYEPSNCKWSTKKEQANNRRDCHYITYKDKTLTVVQWEEYLGFKRNLISQRLSRGWSEKRALETKRRK
jgi:hypothetical protein